MKRRDLLVAATGLGNRTYHEPEQCSPKGEIMSKKFIIAWIVLFVAWLLGDFVIHAVLLRPDYMQLSNLFRTEGDQQKYLPLMLLAHVIMSGALVWIYALLRRRSDGDTRDDRRLVVSRRGIHSFARNATQTKCMRAGAAASSEFPQRQGRQCALADRQPRCNSGTIGRVYEGTIATDRP